jgi:hypothetical protein
MKVMFQVFGAEADYLLYLKEHTPSTYRGLDERSTWPKTRLYFY